MTRQSLPSAYTALVTLLVCWLTPAIAGQSSPLKQQGPQPLAQQTQSLRKQGMREQVLQNQNREGQAQQQGGESGSQLVDNSRNSSIEEGVATITVSALRRWVVKLASPELGGRFGEGGTKAAELIAGRFRELKLRGAFDQGQSFFQKVPWDGRRRAFGPDASIDPQDPTKQKTNWRNVAAVIPGRDPELADQWILLGAHFDGLGTQQGVVYPGADDNASGIAMLLETARVLSQKRPARSVLLVAFDLEERGLIGSRYFVEHCPIPLEKLRLCVIADMIGRDAGGLIRPMVYMMGSEYVPGLRPWVREANSEDGLKLGFLAASLVGGRSDHTPFWRKDIPFLFFSTGEHPDYHRPGDTAEKLNYPKFAQVSRVICRVVWAGANRQQLPNWQNEPVVDLSDVQTVVLTLQEALAAPKGPQPGTFEHALATNTLQSLQAILERGSITKAEREWLISICKVLLKRMPQR